MRLAGMMVAWAMVAMLGAGRASAAPKTAEEQRKIDGLKERIALLEKAFNEEKARWEEAYARMDKDSPKTQAALEKHKEKMQAMRVERQDLLKRIEVLEAANSNQLEEDQKIVASLRQQVEEIDKRLEVEEDKFYREYSRLPRESKEAKELRGRYDAKVASLQAERYKLVRRVAEVKSDMKRDAEDLRRALSLLEEEIAEEKQRHEDKLSALAARQTRIREQLELSERPRVLAANELRERIADIDKRLAEEQRQFDARVAQINMTKHRIFVMLQQPNLSPQQAGELRARMAEQDRTLASLRGDHARRVEELQRFKAELERQLERVEHRRDPK